MIIVKLIGGLGNQMFQYALGRTLADRLHVPLKLDITGFCTYAVRRYSLPALSIEGELATDAEISRATGARLARARRLVHRLAPEVPACPRRYVRERGFSFDPDILNAPDGSYLEGYWQSDKYFADSEQRLRVEFSVREPLQGRNLELAEELRERCSVSLHVRRGDYYSNPEAALVHATCDAEYFHRCVEHLAERVDHPSFFVFSDEPDWARENLHIPYPTTVVSHNDDSRNYEDLRLMSLCDHHIIANSSFSWWGAWLDPEPHKIVLMPKQWFRDRSPEETTDIRPEGWTAI